MSEQRNKNNHPLALPPEAKMVLTGGLWPGNPRIKELAVDLTGKQKPNILLVPTPKNKPGTFAKSVAMGEQVFGEEVGANVSVLHDFGNMPTNSELIDKFSKADMIHISGGNTRHAMQLWQKHGIDKMLDQSMREGKVMSGISAGALSWFQEGHSDSESYEVQEGEPWNYSIVRGMGHIAVLATAHLDSKETPDGRLRSEHFGDLLASRSLESNGEVYGLGIDNHAALLAIDGLVRVVRSDNKAGLHVLSASPDGYRKSSELEAPSFAVSPNKASADLVPAEGMSWDAFYKQLGHKTV